jgi:glycine oxidase
MSPQSSSTDVTIIGGGAIGLAVGWRALRRGLTVTLVERGGVGEQTSRVAAGMIAPIAEATPSEPALLALAQESARLYPAFVSELIADSGHDPLYRGYGTLLVARDDDEAEALEREFAFRRRMGLPVTRLLASETRAMEPALAPTLRLGLEIPDDHAIDPRALTTALQIAFERAGGVLLTETEAAHVIVDRPASGDGDGNPGAVTGIRLAGGEVLATQRLVVAAGPWSGGLPGLPEAARVPIRPVKGQILCLRDPGGPGLVERVLRMQPGYLVPRGDGRYVLGATVEERGFDTTVTVQGVFELLRDAVELVPGVGELVIEELVAGIRPGTPDNAPIVGAGALDGLFWATGHYRHGILLAPITAELLASALLDEELPALAAPFDPRRFADRRHPAVL